VSSAAVKAEIRDQALALGFDPVGIAGPDLGETVARNLRDYVALGCHGHMDWLERRAEARSSPRALWPEVRSVVVLGLNYGPDEDPLEALSRPSQGAISVYARNVDYHDVVKKRLKRLGRWMVERYACEIKVFVDTAPVMEKPLAERAGVGWQGKHTNLISRDYGSWLFLGEIYTTLELPADGAESDHCGTCRKCLDICPTNAFLGPYRLDARRCISYLTIEHKGHIAREFREPMGNRIYGCDDCLAVCPWNKFAQSGREAAFHTRPELAVPLLADLAELDDPSFRRLFTKSPVKRLGRDRFLRNVLIAVGNSGAPALAQVARRRLDDGSPLVRAMAVWALWRLLEPADFAAERAGRLTAEPDPAVRAEWDSDGEGQAPGAGSGSGAG
jgi:epoxyqueuosine reductase